MEPIKFQYPAYIEEAANYIAMLRSACNYNLTKANPRFDRGNNNTTVHTLGLIAEMAFQHYLTTQKIEYKSAPLLDSKPVGSYDIKIKNCCIDVKGMNASTKQFMVNKEAHEKQKKINVYIFVQLLGSNVAQFWKFKHSDIDNWEVKEFKYSKAYYKNLTNDARPTAKPQSNT